MALSHRSIGLSSACCLQLGACRLRLASRRRRRSTQYELTVPRTCRSGAVAMLRVKDGLHHLDVVFCCRNHKRGITYNVAIVTPVFC